MRKLEVRKCPDNQETGQTTESNKKLIVVLTGGGAKGAFQVGAWNRIIQEGLNFEGEILKIWIPEAVFGVSVGAFNGDLIAKGKNAELVKLWNRIAEQSQESDCGDKFMWLFTDGDVKKANPLSDAIKYVISKQQDTKNEYYFLIISCNADFVSTTCDITFNEFLRINTLVKQSESKGLALFSDSGRTLQNFKYKIIQPQRDLGSVSNFSRSIVMDAYLHGYEVAQGVIKLPNWD